MANEFNKYKRPTPKSGSSFSVVGNDRRLGGQPGYKPHTPRKGRSKSTGVNAGLGAARRQQGASGANPTSAQQAAQGSRNQGFTVRDNQGRLKALDFGALIGSPSNYNPNTGTSNTTTDRGLRGFLGELGTAYSNPERTAGILGTGAREMINDVSGLYNDTTNRANRSQLAFRRNFAQDQTIGVDDVSPMARAEDTTGSAVERGNLPFNTLRRLAGGITSDVLSAQDPKIAGFDETGAREFNNSIFRARYGEGTGPASNDLSVARGLAEQAENIRQMRLTNPDRIRAQSGRLDPGQAQRQITARRALAGEFTNTGQVMYNNQKEAVRILRNIGDLPKSKSARAAAVGAAQALLGANKQYMDVLGEGLGGNSGADANTASMINRRNVQNQIDAANLGLQGQKTLLDAQAEERQRLLTPDQAISAYTKWIDAGNTGDFDKFLQTIAGTPMTDKLRQRLGAIQSSTGGGNSETLSEREAFELGAQAVR